MKNYIDVISSIKETKTLASHITKIGKIKAKTEDSELFNILDNAIKIMQITHANSKQKSTPVCLENFNDNTVQKLINYCNNVIGSKKPEWQIIAERKGWTLTK